MGYIICTLHGHFGFDTFYNVTYGYFGRVMAVQNWCISIRCERVFLSGRTCGVPLGVPVVP